MPGVHFTAFNGRLTWADGEGGSKTFPLPVFDNALVAGDRTVVLTLADPVNGTSLNVPNLAVVTIQDDDFGPGVFGFTNGVFNALESDSNAVVWVSRTNGFTGTATVQYATFTGGNDLAVPGQHYTSTNGTLTFTNGVTNLSFLVPVFDNGQQDGIRIFSVRLSGATDGALLGRSNAAVRILDNEPSAGSVDPGFLAGLGPNGSVLAIQLATNGQSLIAGDFSTFDGQLREKVARVNLDGTLDPTFNAGSIALGRVSALAVYVTGPNADKVVIGGNFSTVGTTARGNVARLNVNGTVDLSFDPGTGANNAVRAVGVAVSGHVLLGGAFTAVNGVARNFIARLNPDGTVDPAFAPGVGPDAQVRALALQPDGKVIIAGDFDTVAGVPHRRIARLNGDGTLDPTFLPGGLITNGNVFSLTLQLDGQILVAGQFTTTNAIARTNLIRLTATGALDTGFNVDASLNVGVGPNDFVAAAAVQTDGRILAGGAFTTFNGIGRNGLVRLDSGGTNDPTFNIGTGANDVVAAIAVQRNREILVGGAFTTFNGVAQNHLTRLNGGTNLGAGGLSFSQPLFTVSEAGTNATLTVVRSGGTSNTVTVDYTVSPGGTALPGVDFFAVGGTLTFAPGETLRTFLVPVIDDLVVRPDRTVFLTLANVTGGAALVNIPPTTVLVIQDNDSLVEFAAATFSVVESVTDALVTVIRSGGTNELVTVAYFTAGLTATPGLDYTNAAGALRFLPGVTNLSFLVPVVEDAFIEGGETVALFLTNAGPIGIGSLGVLTNATLTIVDNDFGPGVLGFAVTNFSYAENVGLASVTVVRTNGSLGGVSVGFATVDGGGTATTGADYLSTNGTLTFADGEESKTFAVRLIDDGTVEASETVALRLFNATGGATLGLTNSLLTIVDDDAFGTFQFSTNSYTVAEAARSVTVTVRRVGGIIGAVSVDIATVAGTAVGGLDFTPFTQVLNFAPGQTSSNLLVQVVDDQVVEPLESFSLVLANPRGGALLGALTNTTVTITDEDMQFSFAVTNFNVLENAGNAIISVIRYGVSNLTGTVSFATSDAIAINGVDYVGVTNTLTFLPGVTNTNFTVSIIDNSTLQLNRFLNLSLANATPTNIASVGTNAVATLSIVDNDNSFSFSASGYTVNESAGSLVVTVLRFGQNTGLVSVAYSSVPLAVASPATATADYTVTAATLSFTPGQSNLTFAVPILADLLPEGDEQFGLILTNPLPAGATQLGGTNTVTVNIVDDDIGIGFSSSAYIVGESAGPATITIIRSGVTNTSVSVAFATTNGTATNGLDYIATNAVFVFAPGVTGRTFTVPIVNDSLPEPAETVGLRLSNPSGGAFLTISNATLTIVDNVGSLGFTAANFLVGESSPNGVVFVTRSGGSAGAITVQYLTASGGTATSGLDYADVSGTLSWTDGDPNTTKSFFVPIFNDQRIEATETIMLRLVNATPGVSFGISNATLSIVDNDGPGSVDFAFDPVVGFDQTVFAVVQQTDGQLVAAGRFNTYNGQSRNKIARVDTSGVLDTNFNTGLGADNSINALLLQPDGRFIIGGDFTSVGGLLRSRVARLLANGSLDTSFSVGSGANGSVNALALQPDGKVIIGGGFTSYNGSVSNSTRIARLNTSGSLDTSFNTGTGGANGFVQGITVYTNGTNLGKVLVVGSFTTFGGAPVNRIVRLNADGTRDTTFTPGTGANSTVAAVSIQPDGKILIGGLFTSINGTPRSRVARLNHDGTLDATFFPVMNDTVLSLAVQQDGKILAGGAFTGINGDTGTPPAPGIAVSFRERTTGVATLTTTGGHSLSIGSRVNIASVGTGFDGTFTVTAVSSATRFSYASAGADVVPTAVTPNGTFSAAGTPASRVVRFLADGTVDTLFATGTGADNLVFAVLPLSDLKVLLVGDFTVVNSAPRGRIARLNGDPITQTITASSAASVVGGQFSGALSAEPGRSYRIDFSTDLRVWMTLTTVNSGHGVLTFTDNTPPGSARRYYRAVLVP